MTEIPDTSNFYSSLYTTQTKEEIARLYGALGWRIRKCSWIDYEVICPWAELIIESDSPILLHGPVADVLNHMDELIAPLRAANISFTAACYGPNDDLLREAKG